MLAITLRFLATEKFFRRRESGFRVANDFISKFIPKVCDAIIEEYIREVVSLPTTPQGWRTVTDIFASRWICEHTCRARLQAYCRKGSFEFLHLVLNLHGIFLPSLLGSSKKTTSSYGVMWKEMAALQTRMSSTRHLSPRAREQHPGLSGPGAASWR